MPESPEVEAFARWLKPQVLRRRITSVEVPKPRLVRPLRPAAFAGALEGCRIVGLRRCGKCLLWDLEHPGGRLDLLVSHLGMTGVWQVLAEVQPLPRHAAVVLGLGGRTVVMEDPRQFGHLRLGSDSMPRLGPDPLAPEFTAEELSVVLSGCRRPVKVCLMDPARLAGVGNLYASEALFLAGIDPSTPADAVAPEAVVRLHRALRDVLATAVERNLRALRSDRPMLYQQGGASGSPEQGGLWVYDRAGHPCHRCGSPIERLVQAGRSTYRCPRCQAR